MKDFGHLIIDVEEKFRDFGFLTETINLFYTMSLDRGPLKHIIKSFPDNKNLQIIKNMPEIFVLHHETPNGYHVIKDRQFINNKNERKENILSPIYGAFFVKILDNISGSFNKDVIKIYREFYPLDKISVFVKDDKNYYCEWLNSCLSGTKFLVKKQFYEFMSDLGIKNDDE